VIAGVDLLATSVKIASFEYHDEVNHISPVLVFDLSSRQSERDDYEKPK
jgi:hypothetical protein